MSYTSTFFTVLTALLFISSSSFSQDYELVYSSETYAPLAGATQIDEAEYDLVNTFIVYNEIPIGFDFEFEGFTYSTVRMAENGYALFYEGAVNNSYIAIYDCPLKDFQDTPAESPINYTTTGTPGNRIFKCEYVKAGLKNDDNDEDYVSFQLWIYEQCNNFEIRLGESSIDNTDPDLFWNDNTSAFFGYGSLEPPTFNKLLAGPSISPVIQEDPLMTLTDLPANGTVYNFNKCVVGIEEEESSSLSYYPNPTRGLLAVVLKENQNNTAVLVTDPSGQILMTQSAKDVNQLEFDLSNLAAGIYLIQVVGDHGVESYKIIKE